MDLNPLYLNNKKLQYSEIVAKFRHGNNAFAGFFVTKRVFSPFRPGGAGKSDAIPGPRRWPPAAGGAEKGRHRRGRSVPWR